ncbi:MAG: MASE1 domain-containing protein, partial [Candidatus Acidiferrum sp.]
MKDTEKLTSRLRMIALAGVVGVVCYLAAAVGGILIINVPQTLWPLWPGCAVLVAILLVTPRKIWPFLIPAGLAGFVLYDLQAGVPLGAIAWLMLTDVVEIMVTAGGLCYFMNGLPRLDSLKGFAKYSFFTVILGPAVTASIGIHALNGDRWISWRSNFLSEGLAFLTLTPAILGWFGEGRAWLRARRARHLEAGVLFAALIGLSYAVFVARGTNALHATPALLYSLVPFLVWAALRFGSMGAG